MQHHHHKREEEIGIVEGFLIVARILSLDVPF